MADIDNLSIQITSDVNDATKGIDALVASLEKLKQATSGLGLGNVARGMQQVANATNSATAANNANAKSVVNLGAKLSLAYTAIRKGAKMIGSSIGSINDYIEDINLFNVAMGEYAKEAGEYAQTVGDIMGIDPGEWMRNQAMFMTLATGFGIVNDRAYTMSKNLTQLGYDISSFFNISYEDAMAKLQSGIAGELEPLRRIGYDLSQARLQQEAYILGIDKKVAKMTQAEKAELRYHAIMTQVTTAQGDMARTLSAPANQLRILSAQFTQAARAIGSIFIPMLNAVLPYVTAFTILIRDLAANLASLFGFEMPEVDYSGVNSLASGADDAANALTNATEKAKKLKKFTMGFDELNVIDPTSDESDNGESGIGGGKGFEFDLPEYDFVGDAVSKQIDALKTALGLTISDVFLEWGNDLTAENILEKIVTGITAITGGLIGYQLGGIPGAILGASLGMTLGLIINSLVFDHDGKVSMTEFYEVIRDIFTVGAGGVLGFTIGGFGGAAVGISIGFALTLLLEALEMKGNDSIAHSLENALATLIPVGLGVGLGKSVGLEFLTGFDFAFSKGDGVFASISKGLSDVSKSMSTFQRSMTGVVGGIASFIGVFTGVKNITFDVSNGSATLSSVLAGLIPIVAGLTAGFVAFSIAFNSTGIGLIVTAIVAAGAALVGLIAGIKEAGEAAYAKTTDFAMMEDILSRSSTTIDTCKTALDNMKSGIDSLDKVSNDFAVASTLLGEIMDINENANASAYELAEMQTKVDILNDLGIEGLSLSIDETTGRVVESREAVEKLIESLEQEAKMEAMRDLLVQSYKDQYQAISDAKKATNDYNVANEALQKTADELAKCPWYDFKTRSKLQAAQEKETEALEKANEAYETAKSTITDLESTIGTYTKELTNMKLNEEGVGDELVKGLGNIEDGLVETAKKMPKLGADISDGIIEGAENAHEKNKSSWKSWALWPWNRFKDENDINSPSKLFESGGGDIAKGLFNGVSNNTKQSEYSNVFGRLKTWFDDLLGTTNGDSTVFSSLGKLVAGGLFGGVSDNIKQTEYEGVFGNIKNWFNTLFGTTGDTKSSVFSTLGGLLSGGLKSGVDGGVVKNDYDTIFGRISTALTGVKTNIAKIINGILGFIEKMANGVIKGVNFVIDGLNKLKIDVPEWVTDKFGIDDFGFNIPKLQEITIPKISLMAEGGFVDKGQMFIAREAGAEMVGSIGRRTAVANNEQIVAGIERGVASANTESNALLREQNNLLRALLDKETNIAIDGKTVTKSIERYQRDRGRVLMTGGAY